MTPWAAPKYPPYIGRADHPEPQHQPAVHERGVTFGLGSVGEPRVDPRLQHDERAGEHDQYGNHDPERLWHREQQDRADQGAGDGGRYEPREPVPLALQFAPVSVGARGVAGDESDVVRHVGDDRWETQGDQDRERDQRTRSDDRVDATGRDTRGEDRQSFDRRHLVPS